MRRVSMKQSQYKTNESRTLADIPYTRSYAFRNRRARLYH